MNAEIYQFKLLTDCFCRGSKPNEIAEMREASIRGHIRRWHTMLFGEESTIETWGGIKAEKPVASKIVLKILDEHTVFSARIKILPHKLETKALAIPKGEVFNLQMTARAFAQENHDLILKAKQSIYTWLLCGSLGARSTRGFGSVFPAKEITESDFIKEILTMRGKASFYFAALENNFEMKTFTDTLNGYDDIFGFVRGTTRKTSPLKMKVVLLSGKYHLLLHAPSEYIITQALELLKNKPLGRLDLKKIC